MPKKKPYDHFNFPSGLSVRQARADAKQLAKERNIKLAEAQRIVTTKNGLDLEWAEAIEFLKTGSALPKATTIQSMAYDGRKYRAKVIGTEKQIIQQAVQLETKPISEQSAGELFAERERPKELRALELELISLIGSVKSDHSPEFADAYDLQGFANSLYFKLSTTDGFNSRDVGGWLLDSSRKIGVAFVSINTAKADVDQFAHVSKEFSEAIFKNTTTNLYGYSENVSQEDGSQKDDLIDETVDCGIEPRKSTLETIGDVPVFDGDKFVGVEGQGLSRALLEINKGNKGA